jgi:hypothetical protein
MFIKADFCDLHIKHQKISQIIKTRTKYFVSLKYERRIMSSKVYKQSIMLQLNTFFDYVF